MQFQRPPPLRAALEDAVLYTSVLGHCILDFKGFWCQRSSELPDFNLN